MKNFFKNIIIPTIPFLVSSCGYVHKHDPVIDRIEVSIKEQKLKTYQNGKQIKTYEISTSKYGVGNKVGSKKTPLGKHKIVEKIGEGLPLGSVLKARVPTGQTIPKHKPTPATMITSRILRLKGLEPLNSNTYRRCVYVHGTTQSSKLGTPASIGCIRVGDEDISEIFEKVVVGATVEIKNMF